MSSYSFTKLFSTITDSSVWATDSDTRVVWVTMLAMSDRNGCIFAAIPGLANRARVSLEAAEKAIAQFLSPDRYSRTPTDEGRRIRVIDGGWQLLNYGKYRQLRDTEAERERKRKWASSRRAASKIAQDSAKLPQAEAEYRVQSTHTPLTGSPEGCVGGVSGLLGELMSLYRREPGQRPSYHDESVAVEIVRRPTWSEELNIIRNYHQQLEKGGEGRYFPGSLSSLLDNWDGTLDRARQRSATKRKSISETDAERAVKQALQDIPDFAKE